MGETFYFLPSPVFLGIVVPTLDSSATFAEITYCSYGKGHDKIAIKMMRKSSPNLRPRIEILRFFHSNSLNCYHFRPIFILNSFRNTSLHDSQRQNTGRTKCETKQTLFIHTDMKSSFFFWFSPNINLIMLTFCEQIRPYSWPLHYGKSRFGQVCLPQYHFWSSNQKRDDAVCNQWESRFRCILETLPVNASRQCHDNEEANQTQTQKSMMMRGFVTTL